MLQRPSITTNIVIKSSAPPPALCPPAPVSSSEWWVTPDSLAAHFFSSSPFTPTCTLINVLIKGRRQPPLMTRIYHELLLVSPFSTHSSSSRALPSKFELIRADPRPHIPAVPTRPYRPIILEARIVRESKWGLVHPSRCQSSPYSFPQGHRGSHWSTCSDFAIVHQRPMFINIQYTRDLFTTVRKGA